MTQFERTEIGRVRLHVMPTDRFKTFEIAVFAGQPLTEQTVTAGALIPYVLRRGNRKYPETMQFRSKLADLYGAGFGFDISKRGDYHVAGFRMDTINDRYVKGARGFLQETAQYLGETLTDPFVENDAFHQSYVNQEKETIKRRIEALINDKIRYAAERCIQEMCKGDPYSLNTLGQLDQLQLLDAASLYQAYTAWIDRSIWDIYVVGDTTLQEVTGLVEAAFQIKKSNAAENKYSQTAFRANEQQVKEVTERLDVTQGKLNMGFRVHTTYSDVDYPVAMMYNGILGGFPHSKLFINVREKASLAYYAASRLDAHKGIMTIQSGIEIQNEQQAKEIILKQVDAMRNGEISELELSQTKAMIINALQEVQDSAYGMISFDFNRILSETSGTVEDMIASIRNVDKNDIQLFAEKVELDTVYFLRDRKEE